MWTVGVDVGNATTEAVLADVDGDRVRALGWDRLPTRGPKGSPASLDGAVRLVRRLERAHRVAVELVVVAPLRPVSTLTATLPEPAAGTGRLTLIRAGSNTAAGQGAGYGPPYLIGGSQSRPAGPQDVVGSDTEGGQDAGYEPPHLSGAGEGRPAGPVIAVVPQTVGYAQALPELTALAGDGMLAGVVLARDEAVLLANRLPTGAPVVDEVDTERALAAELLAVEVRPPGQPLRLLTDPLRLGAELGLSPADRPSAVRLAALLYDYSNAVVALHTTAPDPVTSGTAGDAWVTVGGDDRLPLPGAHAALRAGPPGWARGYQLPHNASAGRSGDAAGSAAGPDAGVTRLVDDLYTVDLAGLSDGVLARAGALSSRTMVLAAMHADTPYTDPAADLADRLGVPVRTAPSEALAAWLGGLSTPGAGPHAAVVDLGGGTIDVVTEAGAVIVAGAGELLTAATADLLGTGRAAAEWAKRGPGYRVEGPQVLLAEDGSRTFLDRPLGPDAVGALVTTGPAGWLPFDRAHAPSEWRALRLRLKSDVLGDNVARALRALEVVPPEVVVVGGPAGDDEVLACVARALPPGTAVGRGNAAALLGHRHVVAYGLLLT